MLYLEFLFVVADYFRTLRKRYVIFEWGLPLIIAIFMSFQVNYDPTQENGLKNLIEFIKSFSGSAVSLLGVLIAFSLTGITLLTTSSSSNIDEIKNKMTDVKIGNENISLYRLILVNLTYSVVIEIITLLTNICFPWVVQKTGGITLKAFLSVDLFFVIHIMLLTLRNTSDMYFILFRKETQQQLEKR